MKPSKCQIKDCKERACAFINKKQVCKKHFDKIKGKTKETMPGWLVHYLKLKSPTKRAITQIKAPYWEEQSKENGF